MNTTGDMIRAAMRKGGILAPGEPLPPNEGNDALKTFSQMIDAWSAETLLIPVVGTVSKELIPGQAEYTIGVYPDVTIPANHIETARPERILAALLRDAYGTDYTQDIIDVKTFNRISRKTTESRPSGFYLRKAWPLNTILFESTPYVNDTLKLEVLQPLSEILTTATLTDAINLPPGYERTIIYNLAMDLIDEWGKQPSSMIATTATEGKKWLKRNNYRPMTLGMDRALITPRRAKGTYQINDGP
jgi:hypothetical protein